MSIEKKDRMGRMSRRDFVNGTAAGGLAAAMGGLVLAATPASAQRQTPGKPRKWDKEADVIVIGSGAAGMPATVAAVEAGASVILVEKNTVVGGCALISQGFLGIGGGSQAQRSANVDDSADLDYAFYMDFRSRENRRNVPEVLRAFCDRSGDTIDWLVQHGVQVLNPAVRSHSIQWNVLGPGWLYGSSPTQKSSGAGMIKPLEAVAKAKGVDIQLGTEMTKLIRDGGTSGRVIGVVAKAGSQTLNFSAKKAVILASGSWKGHKYLRSLQDPRITDKMTGTGYPFINDDGMGMLAAIEAGSIMTGDRADDRHVWHRMFGTRYYRFAPGQPFAAPGIGTLGQLSGDDMGYIIFVNKAGVRFVNEAAGETTNGFYDYALAQPEHIIWTIFDDAAATKNHWTPTPPTVEPNMAFSASTWADLANAISVPADALTNAVTKYNLYVDQKADPDFKKARIYLTNKIATPPFYAVAVSLQVHDTMGGLPINAKAQVLDIYGKVIPGLYAAGEVAGSLDLIGMPKGVVMGRIAGEAAAAEKANL